MRAINEYFRASWGELQKVIWPTRRQAITLTAAVILGAMIVGVYLTIFGYGYQTILQKLLFKS